MDDNYADSRAFVKKMRALSRKRDLNSIQQAVQQMQDWLLAHPYDIHVGTALEEFSILEEAAHIIEARKAQSVPPQSDSVAKAS